MEKTYWELALGVAIATMLVGACLRLVAQRRKTRRRVTRRRRNIAYARAWDWLYGRQRHKMLEDKSSSPEH